MSSYEVYGVGHIILVSKRGTYLGGKKLEFGTRYYISLNAKIPDPVDFSIFKTSALNLKRGASKFIGWTDHINQN